MSYAMFSFPRVRALLFASSFTVLALGQAYAGNADLPELFTEDYSLVAYMASSLFRDKALPHYEGLDNAQLVKFNPDLFNQERFSLHLDHQHLMVVSDYLRHNGVQGTWVGHIEQEPQSEIILTKLNNIVTGEIQYAGKTYEIRHYQDDLYLVLQLDPFKAT